MNENEQTPPALPGEVWRGAIREHTMCAAAVRDGEVWTYVWEAAEYGPAEWWSTLVALIGVREDIIAAWATAERARAEKAEAEVERGAKRRDQVTRVLAGCEADLDAIAKITGRMSGETMVESVARLLAGSP